MVKSIEGKRMEYYEAIIQLRDIEQEVYDFSIEQIEKGKIHIAKVEDVKGGVDIYLADRDFAKTLGKKLQLKFGGKLLLSASLYGIKDGREIFRVTILFREVTFVKGDRVDYKGDECIVKTVAKEIVLQHIKSGKIVHVKYKEMEKIKLMEE
ncbi:hypothetical protein J4444_02255 [Candidatus Woesearchaeota archaeon]|nr:hypothetical protein [Candidatus Woesearchaeota archaeon]